LNILGVVSYIVGIDQNIIEINYHTDIEEVEKDIIHKVLESSGSIIKTKKHNRLFKGSVVSTKSSLPFVTFSTVD